MRNGRVEKTREHWVSQSFEVRNHDEAINKLYDLVIDLKEYLKAITASETTLMTELVSHCDNAEKAHGFYFPPELMQLFSSVGMSLDIDQYYDFEDIGYP